MILIRSKKVLLTFALAGLAACGSDSSGPGSIEADDALRSLSLGLGGAGGGALPYALAPSALGTASRGIDQIDVSIGGTTHSMYALGLSVTYPEGTCIEDLFIVSSIPRPPGCSPPPLGLVLVLWQTTSGSRPPKRMVFITGNLGTTDFGFLPLEGEFSETDPIIIGPRAIAFYANDQEEFWGAVSGSLTSSVTPGSETCSVPAPPYAASSTCHFATFDEAGTITFERYDLELFNPGPVPSAQRMDFVIPRQNVRGILQAITETKPFTFPASPFGFTRVF
jgi:hypothetical protein